VIDFDNEVRCVAHANAPLSELALLRPADLYAEAVSIVRGGRFDVGHAEDAAIVRTMSLCNLHFFLKYVAGFSGPYDEINDDLQMEMCNWRQSALLGGSKNAAFVPRSSMKSTTLTHGAITWELLRNPNLRVGIFSATIDRAVDFMHQVQRNFDSNDLMKALFADHCPERQLRGGSWNDTIAVMPNRSRNMPEPSLRAHTASGTTAGVHVDLAQFDDIVSDSQLNSERMANAEMIRIGHWFTTAVPTLLRSQSESRIVLAATRYDLLDPYEAIMLDACERGGDWTGLDGFYPVAAEGLWHVYYRTWCVDGESIMPEAYTVASMARLARDDPWTYATQYVNNPHNVSTQEFGSYELRECELEYDEARNDFVIKVDEGEDVYLRDCDVVAGIDPAASEKRVSRHTSRSAVAIVARDVRDRIFVIDARCDYVDSVKMMDWLFTLRRRYERYMRVMRLEVGGPFKLLVSLLHREEQIRGIDLNFVAIAPMGDKLPTIRLVWEPFLKRNAVFVCKGSVAALVRREFNVFPSQMLDLMDAIKLAIAGTHSIVDEDGVRYGDEDDEREMSAWSRRHAGVTGY
jgi:hypothetical protein